MKKGNERKNLFRRTSAWKKWRLHMLEVSGGIDYVTHKPLRKGCNVHHLDECHYDTLTDDRFVVLNVKTHEVVEWLWTYYQKDPDAIKRLETVMEKMKFFQEGNNIE